MPPSAAEPRRARRGVGCRPNPPEGGSHAQGFVTRFRGVVVGLPPGTGVRHAATARSPPAEEVSEWLVDAADIDDIWADSADAGLKKDLGPLIDRGLKLC